MSVDHRRLALALAASQRGITTRAQLLANGITQAQIRSLLDTGTFTREAGGVYCAAGAPSTYAQRVTLALAAAGPGAVASHGCAARLLHLGIPGFNAAGVEITVPAEAHLRDAKRFGVVHRSRHLEPRDTTSVARLRVTTALRVAVDCAAMPGITTDVYCALVDDVLFRFGTPDALRATWVRSGKRTGRAWLDAALGPYVDGAPPESPKEMSLARVCWMAGLPLPDRQVVIVDPRSGRVAARCDLGYREARLGLEYLGRRFHGTRHRSNDEVRHESLELLGWQILYADRSDLVAPGSAGFARGVATALVERLSPSHPTRRSAEVVLAKLAA